MPKSVTISAAPVASGAITDTVNYCLNPSFEVNVTDDWSLFWEAGAGSTVTRDTTLFKVGIASMRVKASNAPGAVWQAVAGVSVPNNGIVTVSVWIQGAAGMPWSAVQIWDVTNGAVRGIAVATAAAIGAWEYLTVSWLNNTGLAATCRLLVQQNAGDGITNVWFDACQLELGPATPYTDGSLGTHYSWDGAAHNSVSRHITPAGVRRGYMRNLRPAAGPSNALAEAGTFSNYSHKIRGLGGFWQCSFVWHDELSVLMEMMAEGWVRDILVMGERGMEVWEGFVAAMELSLTGGMPALKVTGYGYFRTLFWRVYNQTASGHVDAFIHSEIAAIVAAVGQFITSTAINANYSMVDRYHDADRNAGDIIFDDCAAGDILNRRHLAGCYEGRQLRYQEIAKYQVV